MRIMSKSFFGLVRLVTFHFIKFSEMEIILTEV